MKRPYTEPSGWAFEFQNDWYPDIDDTAMVMLALASCRQRTGALRKPHGPRYRLASRHAIEGRRLGGVSTSITTGKFSRTCRSRITTRCSIPPAPISPAARSKRWLPTVLTAPIRPASARIDYLIRTQQADGSWYGRWGVAYIYGTCFALRGLRAMAEDDHEPHIQRANEWLRSHPEPGWRLGRKLRQLRSTTVT